MIRLVSPAGTPTRLSDLTRMVGNRLGSLDASLSFEQRLKEITGAEHCFLFGSGRAGMTCLLNCLKKEDGAGRDEVVIPAYTCFSVPAAIIRAGLKVRLVDIDPANLDYDKDGLSRLNLDKVLAIIGCNLFGILTDMSSLRQLIGERPIALIDDAAQSLGCRTGDEISGRRGMAGLYSLGRGKNLSAYSGGVLVTDDSDLAEKARLAAADLTPVSMLTEFATGLKIGLTSLMLRPALYWLPAGLPFLGLGQTVYDPDFEFDRLSQIQAGLGIAIIDRLEQFNEGRRKVAEQIAPEAVGTGVLDLPGYHPDRPLPNYLRLPLLARSKTDQNRAIAAMKETGVSASIMYPTSIDQIPGIKKHLCDSGEQFKSAEMVAERLFTLPTHGYVRQSDVENMIAVLKQLG